MKINWGTGLVIAMIGFISFILFFVITMFTDKDLEHELVVEEYYKQEIGFQEVLDAEKNALELSEQVTVEKTGEGVYILFPKDKVAAGIAGTVSFYRPSKKQLDFTLPIVLAEGSMLIPHQILVAGRWDVQVAWTYQGKRYIHKEKLMY